MKHIPLVLISLMFLIGCAPNVRPIRHESVVLNVPEVGGVETKELGDTLVSKTIKTEVDVINVYNSVDSYFDYLTFQPGIYTAIWKDDTGVYYVSRNNVIYKPIGKVAAGFLIPFGSKSSQRNVTVWRTNYYLQSLRPAAKINTDGYITFTRGKVTLKDRPFFKQELIYNGKSGNNIKFLYREFSEDYMRSAFTQDIQYDLGESRTIGFKGVRLYIIKATNRQIEYIVRKPFP